MGEGMSGPAASGLWFWLRRFVVFVANRFTLSIQRARQAVIESYICAMSGSVDFLTLEAMDLPPDQRLTLAHRILSSVEPTASPEIDAAWDTEIRNRIARYDTEGAHSIPAVEVFAELDRRLGR